MARSPVVVACGQLTIYVNDVSSLEAVLAAADAHAASCGSSRRSCESGQRSGPRDKVPVFHSASQSGSSSTCSTGDASRFDIFEFRPDRQRRSPPSDFGGVF
eukprot:TRINITY_DN39894_c0_g1_i5.p1 TRINITY_DN39894_c0_g1~~TRINITY_DN39894_c0_g1_i5.p1  ORF type:complete len:102 (-),score=3.02 TRINITY_DN39894_c0_g1_i5:22-327(-)